MKEMIIENQEYVNFILVTAVTLCATTSDGRRWARKDSIGAMSFVVLAVNTFLCFAIKF